MAGPFGGHGLTCAPPTHGGAFAPFQLPVLLKGTSDDDAPCPGYLFEEIAGILPASPRRALGFCPRRLGPFHQSNQVWAGPGSHRPDEGSPGGPRRPMLLKRTQAWGGCLQGGHPRRP